MTNALFFAIFELFVKTGCKIKKDSDYYSAEDRQIYQIVYCSSYFYCSLALMVTHIVMMGAA